MDNTTNLPVREHGNSLILDIGSRWSDPNSISTNLRVLQQHSNLTPFSNLAFLIWPDAPIAEVFQVLVETIECCSRKGYSFHRLIFHECDIRDQTHLAVLRAACRHRLFRFLVMSSIGEDPDNEATLVALKDGMIMNKDLDAIDVKLEVAGASFGMVGDGLRETKHLETLSIGFYDRYLNRNFPQPPSSFLEGLKENQTLQSLSLRCLPTEAWTEEVLKALLDHPTLKTLNLTKCSWGNSSIAALDSLLSSPQCKISTLNLSDPNLRDTRQPELVDNLADVLKSNQTIEWIRLQGFGLDDVALSKLWTAMSAMKRLAIIDVSYNEITSVKSIKKSKGVARLKRLDLEENPILRLEASEAEATSGLFELLQSHPELQCLGQRFSKSKCYSLKLQHLLDINGSGRVLLCDGVWSEHSLWPRVLERANEKFKENPNRQANVMYYLVHGLSASL